MKKEIESGRREFLRLAASQTRFVRAGDNVFAGNSDQTVMIILSGRCTSEILRNGRRHVLDMLVAGNLVGLYRFFGVADDSFVVASTTSTVGSVAHAELHRNLAYRPIGLFISSQFAAEGQRLRAAIAALACLDATERLADLLINMHKRINGVRSISDATATLPVGQQEVAKHLGIAVGHVNRILRQMQIDGILSLRRRAIIIEDTGRLTEIAQGTHPPVRSRARSSSASPISIFIAPSAPLEQQAAPKIPGFAPPRADARPDGLALRETEGSQTCVPRP